MVRHAVIPIILITLLILNKAAIAQYIIAGDESNMVISEFQPHLVFVPTGDWQNWSGTFYLNIDNDGPPDFKITLDGFTSAGGTSKTTSIYGLSPDNQILSVFDSCVVPWDVYDSLYFTKAMEYGDTISISNGMWNDTSGIADYSGTVSYTCQNGGFKDNEFHYAGVTWTNNNVIQLGWIQLKAVNYTDSAVIVKYAATSGYGVGITEIKPVESIKIFPQPANEAAYVQYLSLKAGEDNFKFALYDALGNVVLTSSAQVESKMKIDCHHLPSGIYYYKLRNPQNVIAQGKFVIGR